MSNIDVIIPTFNRPVFLERILKYYQNEKTNFNFIIADSSKASNKRINKRIVNSYPDLKILYVDKLSDKLAQHLKFTEMVKYARSKYCVICADDDFTLPNSIEKCVQFLDKNPDYVAAHGSYIGFHIFNSFNIHKFWWKFRYSPSTMPQADSLERLAYHLENYTQVTFSVRRTKELQKIYKEFTKSKMSLYLLPNYGELIPDVLTVIYGKVKSFSILYSVRQYFGSVAGYYPSFFDARKAGKFEKDYHKFKKCILRNLNIKTNGDRQRALKILDSSFEKYIQLSYHEHLMNRLYLTLSNFPFVISQTLRLIHSIYLFSKDKRNPLGMIDQSSSKYYPEFKKIKMIILNSMQK